MAISTHLRIIFEYINAPSTWDAVLQHSALFALEDVASNLPYLYAFFDGNLTDFGQESIYLAKRIEDFSAKYSGGQMGVVLNGVKENEIEQVYDLLNKYEL